MACRNRLGDDNDVDDDDDEEEEEEVNIRSNSSLRCRLELSSENSVTAGGFVSLSFDTSLGNDIFIRMVVLVIVLRLTSGWNILGLLLLLWRWCDVTYRLNDDDDDDGNRVGGNENMDGGG